MLSRILLVQYKGFKNMTTTNDPENSLKKLPFSEDELLKNIDEYNAHADEIFALVKSEFCKPSTPF
jgi:hypothetical protein